MPLACCPEKFRPDFILDKQMGSRKFGPKNWTLELMIFWVIQAKLYQGIPGWKIAQNRPGKLFKYGGKGQRQENSESCYFDAIFGTPFLWRHEKGWGLPGNGRKLECRRSSTTAKFQILWIKTFSGETRTKTPSFFTRICRPISGEHKNGFFFSWKVGLKFFCP